MIDLDKRVNGHFKYIFSFYTTKEPVFGIRSKQLVDVAIVQTEPSAIFD
jgi:hypothetical protein